jgi:hypothetical protein
MIINVLYAIQADMGSFFTEAQLDVESGKLINVVPLRKEDEEDIREIFKSAIIFEYDKKTFECGVNYRDNSIVNYEQTEFKKYLDSKKYKDHLEKSLYPSNIIENLVKI